MAQNFEEVVKPGIYDWKYMRPPESPGVRPGQDTPADIPMQQRPMAEVEKGLLNKTIKDYGIFLLIGALLLLGKK